MSPRSTTTGAATSSPGLDAFSEPSPEVVRRPCHPVRMEAMNVRRNRIIAGAMVVAIGVGSAALASGAPARPAATYKLSASKSSLKFNVTKITAKAGKVTLRMANPASFKHAVAIKGHGSGKTVGKGGTSTVTATLKKGTYTFYCPVPGHEAAGMKGTLVVK